MNVHFNGFAVSLQIGCKLTRVQCSTDSLESEEAKLSERKKEFGESRWCYVKWDREHVRTTSPFTLPLFFLLCHRMTDVKLLSFRFPLICDSTKLHSLGNNVKSTTRNMDRCYFASQLLHTQKTTCNSCSFMLCQTPVKWAHLLLLFLAIKHTQVANNKWKKMVQMNYVIFLDQFYQATCQLMRIFCSNM